jgi:hypothetical protein
MAWEPMCTVCAADQGEWLMVRINDRTRPKRNAKFLEGHPEYYLEWRKRNRDRMRELKRKWFARNRDARLLKMREYYQANRGKWATVYGRKKAA